MTPTFCGNCSKEIQMWNGKWFHTHNCVTFCNSLALDEKHQPAPVAIPSDEVKQ